MDMAGPDRRRVSLRQVTTATPAGLDFRATGVADEGCADTMSTESPCSIAQGLSGAQARDLDCHSQAPGVRGVFGGDMLEISEMVGLVVWSAAHFSGAASNTSTGGTRANLVASSVDPCSHVSTSVSSIGMTLRLSCWSGGRFGAGLCMRDPAGDDRRST